MFTIRYSNYDVPEFFHRGRLDYSATVIFARSYDVPEFFHRGKLDSAAVIFSRNDNVPEQNHRGGLDSAAVISAVLFGSAEVKFSIEFLHCSYAQEQYHRGSCD